MQRRTGADPKALRKLRDEIGVPRADVGAGARARHAATREASSPPPSAPSRRANDPRAGSDAKVIQMRPVKVDPWVADMLSRIESADATQRVALVEAIENRWPGLFAQSPTQRSTETA